MSDTVTVALITTLGAVALAAIPIVLAWLRKNGVQVSTQQEEFIRDAATEGVAFAEQMARQSSRSLTNQEMLALAIGRATAIIDKHRNVPTPVPEEMAKRIEAAIPAQRESTKATADADKANDQAITTPPSDPT